MWKSKVLFPYSFTLVLLTISQGPPEACKPSALTTSGHQVCLEMLIFTSRFPSYFPMVSLIYIDRLPPPLPQQVIVRGKEKKVSERTRRRLPENPSPCWGGGRAGGSRAWRPACPASLNEGAWEAQGHFSGCPVIPAREPDTRARFLARVVF